MFASKVILGAMLIVTVTASPIYLEDLATYDSEPSEYGPYILVLDDEIPAQLTRVRRQAQGSVTFNSDGSTGLAGKVPLDGNDKNTLSAVGTMVFNNQLKHSGHGLGLALDNVNGHGLTVMKETVPGFGDTLTGAGKLNVFHNSNHDVNARAFATRNMPSIPDVPNYNTVGGGVDYTFKDKIGGSFSMANTPFLQRKEYNAAANLNIFRSPTSSVDFSGGFKKFDTPFMKSNWEPHFGLSFGKSF